MIDREVSYVVTATGELTNSLGKNPAKAKDITVMLDGVVQKLQQLKRKVFLLNFIVFLSQISSFKLLLFVYNNFSV